MKKINLEVEVLELKDKSDINSSVEDMEAGKLYITIDNLGIPVLLLKYQENDKYVSSFATNTSYKDAINNTISIPKNKIDFISDEVGSMYEYVRTTLEDIQMSINATATKVDVSNQLLEDVAIEENVNTSNNSDVLKAIALMQQPELIKEI